MIEFYGMASPNVTKVAIALEELGLAYNPHPVDIWKGNQFEPEFERLNPNRKVPVIIERIEGRKEPVVVFESAAILLYLTERAGRFIPTDPIERSTAIQWMMIQMTGVGPMFGQFVHFKYYAPRGNDYSLTRYHNELLKYYDLLNKRLADFHYLAGDTYTIADIATVPWILNKWTSTEDLYASTKSPFPHVDRWADELRRRPAVEHALAVVDGMKQKVTRGLDATPEQQDRVFSRGKFSRI